MRLVRFGVDDEPALQVVGGARNLRQMPASFPRRAGFRRYHRKPSSEHHAQYPLSQAPEFGPRVTEISPFGSVV